MKFFDQLSSRFPLASVSDYRCLAKKRLPSQLFEFLEGGAFDEITLRENRESFQKIKLKKKVLRSSDAKIDVEIVGEKISFPLILSPVGFAGVFRRRGEVQAAKAAEQAGIPFILSSVGICSLEEVAKNISKSFWFQFYMFKDQNFCLDLLARAEEVGCSTLVLTVDLPIAGARYSYLRSRNSSSLSHTLEIFKHFSWWKDVYLNGKPLSIGNLPKKAPKLGSLAEMRSWVTSQLNSYLSWKDVEWLRSHWKGKLVIKGILDPEDARIAEKIEANGIIVSNHGARHFDSISSTISMLPSIKEAINNHMHIFIDGGISNGIDIIKALSLGAHACMIGKSWIYGLASRGEKGVGEVLSILKNELKISMLHLGVSSIRDCTKELVL